jgi:hypothetical protein
MELAFTKAGGRSKLDRGNSLGIGLLQQGSSLGRETHFVACSQDDEQMDAKDRAEVVSLRVPFEITRLNSTTQGKAYHPNSKVDTVALEHIVHGSLYGLRRSRERKSVCYQSDTHMVPAEDIEKLASQMRLLRKRLKLNDTNLLEEASNFTTPEEERFRREQATSLLYDVTQHESIYHKLDQRSMWLNKHVCRSKWVRRSEGFVILCHFALTIFEYPQRMDRPLTTFKSMLLLELGFVAIHFTLLSIRFYIDTRPMHYFKLFKRPWQSAMFITCVVMLCDILIALSAPSEDQMAMPFRWLRCFRAIILVNYFKATRRTCSMTRRALGTITTIVVVTVIFLWIASLFILMLFDDDTVPGQVDFGSFSKTWDALTFLFYGAVNWPDMMMPAYHENAWFLFLFVPIAAFGSWILMNLVFAAVYSGFIDAYTFFLTKQYDSYSFIYTYTACLS